MFSAKPRSSLGTFSISHLIAGDSVTTVLYVCVPRLLIHNNTQVPFPLVSNSNFITVFQAFINGLFKELHLLSTPRPKANATCFSFLLMQTPFSDTKFCFSYWLLYNKPLKTSVA